jgi:hypothetical protein
MQAVQTLVLPINVTLMNPLQQLSPVAVVQVLTMTTIRRLRCVGCGGVVSQCSCMIGA